MSAQPTQKQRDVYETAGRALYEWSHNVLTGIPDDVKTTPVGQSLEATHTTLADLYTTGRRLWQQGQYQAAANTMWSGLQTANRAQRLIQEVQRDHGSAWDAWWHGSVIQSATRTLASVFARVERMVNGGTSALVGAEGVVALVVVVGLGAWLASK